MDATLRLCASVDVSNFAVNIPPISESKRGENPSDVRVDRLNPPTKSLFGSGDCDYRPVFKLVKSKF